MLEVEQSRALCSRLCREVSPGSKVDIHNRPGTKYTGECLCPEHARQCQKEGCPLPRLYLQESGSNSRAWWGMGGFLLRKGCVSQSWCIQHRHLGEWRPSSTPSLHRAAHSLSSWQASPKPKWRVNCKGWALRLYEQYRAFRTFSHQKGQLSHDQACACKRVSLLVWASVYNRWHTLLSAAGFPG